MSGPILPEGVVSGLLMESSPDVPMPATWDGFPGSIADVRGAIRRGKEVPREMLLALDVAHGILVAEVAARNGQIDQLRAALHKAMPILAAAAQGDVSYGSPILDDPRAFTPDPECSTEAERAAHQAACEAWDRGERPERPPTHEAIRAEGVIGWVTRQPWGLGTTHMQDEEALEAYLAAGDALGLKRGRGAA